MNCFIDPFSLDSAGVDRIPDAGMLPWPIYSREELLKHSFVHYQWWRLRGSFVIEETTVRSSRARI
jgi:hypothetical protein